MSDTIPPRGNKCAPARRRGTRALGAVAIIVVALAVVGAIAAWTLLFRVESPVAAGKPVTLTIKRGSSARTIAEQLAKDGVVANALMFRLRARFTDGSRSLKPGQYALSTGMSYNLVLEKLAKGPDIVYFEVAIPEGFSAVRIAKRIAADTGLPQPELIRLVTTGAPGFAAKYPFLKGAQGGSLEGYLFPKTYQIRKGTPAKAVIDMMLSQFDHEIANVDLSYAKSKGLSVVQVVTIASIIEREVRLGREYPLVSSVIYNRLAVPMRLQLDSTVFYGLPEGTKVLTKADLARATPYNTYGRDGLPAGPICNPGLRAIQAAAKPAKSKYLYYVLTGKDGSQTFTTNYADFLKAVKKYRTLFGH
jgi:UPF0755 protein